MFRKRLDEIQAQTESEKQWWEKRRASIQTEFMKELDEPVTTSTARTTSKSGGDEDAVIIDNSAVSGTSSVRKKKGKN